MSGVDTMTVAKLKQVCKDERLEGWKKMGKQELVALIKVSRLKNEVRAGVEELARVVESVVAAR